MVLTGSKSGSKAHLSGILWATGPADGSGGIFLQVTTEGIPQCSASGPMGVSKHSWTLRNIRQLGRTPLEYGGRYILPHLWECHVNNATLISANSDVVSSPGKLIFVRQLLVNLVSREILIPPSQDRG